MRTSSSTLVILLAAAVSGAPAPHQCGRAVEGGGLYRDVGNFAVVVYSLWHDISPVPALECVVSAAARPARGGAVDYLLVLRVASGLGTCEALVWGVPGAGSKDWKLKYFKSVAP